MSSTFFCEISTWCRCHLHDALGLRDVSVRAFAGGFHPFVCAWSLNASNFVRLFEDYLRRYVGVAPSTFTLVSIYSYIQYIYIICSYFWVSWNPTWVSFGLQFICSYDLFWEITFEPRKTGWGRFMQRNECTTLCYSYKGLWNRPQKHMPKSKQ